MESHMEKLRVMFEPPADAVNGPAKLNAKKRFKYPSEDECMVRRLGAGVLAVWDNLPPDAQQNILIEANLAWDREYGIVALPQKLEAFVKRHPSRLV
jgi:hypothetical protein